MAARHLSLWIYDHIVEAAAPYDLLANLLKVAQGVARITWLPGERGRSLSPERKIELIGRWAEEIGNQYAGKLLDGIERRELRNAVFHADYMLYGSEIRLVGDGEVFTLEEFGDLSGRAHAFHDSMIGLRRYHRGLYTEPRRLPAGPISGVVVGPTAGYPPSRLQALAARRCLNRRQSPRIGAYSTGRGVRPSPFPCKTTSSLCQLSGIAPRRSPVRNPASSLKGRMTPQAQMTARAD